MARMIKSCPYCVRPLPFLNLVLQRLTISTTKPLVCPRCESVISVDGGASMWTSLAIGSTGGYLLGKMLFGSFTIKTVVVGVVAGLILFVVSSYFTAPIRDA